MRRVLLALTFVFLTTFAFGQLTERNPVDELKEQVTKALADANVPLSAEQAKQLALLIEEERQAAENLFGITWDFSQGPPQGDQRDQALAGIQWMSNELRTKLPAYMTEQQRAAWEKYESRSKAVEVPTEDSTSRPADKGRIQQIRVTNNAFNVETGQASGAGGPASGGAKTEVIERGGVGAIHGNFISTFQDEKLNARNPFAENKPPYYERRINGNISGPVIPNRLSLNFTVNDDKQENVGTVKAETPVGPFSLGVTRPTLNRSYDVKGVLQLADAHSLNIGFQYASNDSKNESVGDFILPERASRTQTQNYMVDLREISILSDRTVHDIHFTWHKDHSQTHPFSDALAIIVKDAFTDGGAQNRASIDGNTYELSNLIYYAGEKLTMRSGFQGWYRHERSFSQDNFFGEFTFSDLASFRAGKPLKYRITCCDPTFKMGQTQIAFFSQNDFKLTKTFSLMLGARYSVQSNIPDHNNVDPRIGFAYAIGNSTVIRGGSGIFTQWTRFNDIRQFRQLDGRRLYEIQIDNPGWPDPFASGSIRPRSRRQMEPHYKEPYYLVTQVTLERSLPHNLFVTAGYDVERGLKPNRTRDINAPFPNTGIRPFPDEGPIAQLQSSGKSWYHHIRASMRQRFSIFNVNASYIYVYGLNDQEVASRGRDLALPADSWDLHREWGNSDAPRHTLNASVNSRLPLDVYLTTSMNARSPNYYTIQTGKDDNKDGAITDRPPGFSRNTEKGPGYFDVGFNFSKAFELTRRGMVPQRGPRGSAPGPQMNVFANLNNAFNRTHPGIPSGVMTSPFFRRSYNATSPRTIEVGMRFQF